MNPLFHPARLFTGLILLCLALLGLEAQAGGSRANEPPKFPPDEIAAFSKQVEKVAAAHGARAFLVSRIGRPPEELPPGVRFTHGGVAIYGHIPTQDGRVLPGYVIHNLYQDDQHPDRSALAADFALDFFSGVQVLEAGVVIPTPKLQKRLVQLVESGGFQRLHNPRYSVISNPFDLRYQNCTEHLLDVVNAAIYDTEERDQLKRNARAYFTPLGLRIDPIKLLFGSLFSAEVTTIDHDGPIRIATFSTITAYLEKYGLVQEKFLVTPQGTSEWVLGPDLYGVTRP